MVVYDISHGRIRVRQGSGDQFEFAVVVHEDKQHLRLWRKPCWFQDVTPTDAETRIYLAHASARKIARDAGLMA